MMRRISIFVLAFCWACGSAWGADATLAVDFNSAYVWRGLTLNDGFVAQPSLDVSHKGFGVNIWGNYDFDDYDDTVEDNDFQEVDLTVYYGTTFGKVDVSAGLINYLFPSSGAAATTEIYAGIGVLIYDGLSVGLTVYFDVDEADGIYTNLGLSYALDLTESLGLETGVSIAYVDEDFAEFYSGGTDGGFHEYLLSMAMSYAVNDAFSIGAQINYVDNVDDDVLPDETMDTEVFGGVSISYSF